MQYSLFEIKNSKRILNIIQSEITNTFSKKFTESDSVIIFQMSELCTITKYGYAKHQDEDFVFI
jgi:CRISPR-associated protein Cas2